MGYVSKGVKSNLKAARKTYGKLNGKGFNSPYSTQISNLTTQIANRPDFSYDAMSDPQYLSILDQYKTQGNVAMQDTMANAAALSGGYGNSYAQTAGQQIYDNFIKQAADKIPDLYQAAYAMYRDKGTDLQNQLAMYQGLDDTAYGRYQDRLGNAQNALNYWQGVADNQRAFNYQKGQDAFNNDLALKNFNHQVAQDAFNNGMAQKNYKLQKAASKKVSKNTGKTSGNNNLGNKGLLGNGKSGNGTDLAKKGTKKSNSTTSNYTNYQNQILGDAAQMSALANGKNAEAILNKIEKWKKQGVISSKQRTQLENIVFNSAAKKGIQINSLKIASNNR
ncbi:MAG: hypothetical protein K6G85_00190 [Eubacterium sp.]|nr:hypothetical protein [Eubacterium sp.]